MANNRLKSVGPYPAAIVVHSALPPRVYGEFRFATWAIAINDDLVNSDTISEDEMKSAADTMYHEARHCEQWFRMARWVAGQEKGRKAIDAKKAAKMTKGSPKEKLDKNKANIAEAEAWFKSIYGTDRAHRNATLLAMGPKADAVKAAVQAHDDAQDAQTAKEAQIAAVDAAYQPLRQAYLAALEQYGLKVATGHATPGRLRHRPGWPTPPSGRARRTATRTMRRTGLSPRRPTPLRSGRVSKPPSDSSVIGTLRAVSELLTRKRVKAPEVASALGEIRGDWSGSLPIFLQPRDEHFRRHRSCGPTTRTCPRTSH